MPVEIQQVQTYRKAASLGGGIYIRVGGIYIRVGDISMWAATLLKSLRLRSKQRTYRQIFRFGRPNQWQWGALAQSWR